MRTSDLEPVGQKYRWQPGLVAGLCSLRRGFGEPPSVASW